jgi:hypothetical protein
MSIMIKGIGLSLSLTVRCIIVAAIKRIEVTSSTKAANKADKIIITATSL